MYTTIMGYSPSSVLFVGVLLVGVGVVVLLLVGVRSVFLINGWSDFVQIRTKDVMPKFC